MQIKIVDAMMGSGKTTAAINYINSLDEDTKVLYITPYLTEVERIQSACPTKHFCEPKEMGSKLRGLKYLMSKGENVVSTHALFHYFDRELIDICGAQNYILIMDEVNQVVDDEYELSEDDKKILLKNFVKPDPDTGVLRWVAPYEDGRFLKERGLCELESLVLYGGSVLLWLFPIEAFLSFKDIFILTYMYEAQIQRYYFALHDIECKYIHVKGNSPETYMFTEDPAEANDVERDYASLVHIEYGARINAVGAKKTDLSKRWYQRNTDNGAVTQLKKNLGNFFKNICRTKSNLNIWTSFKTHQHKIRGKGYTKGFLPLNARATNEYRACTSVAYPVNRYFNTFIKNFFLTHGVEVDEDGYAISEMLQFIWRSAIRDGKEIWVYVPSLRMRKLLEQWLLENSVKADGTKYERKDFKELAYEDYWRAKNPGY